ncbi:MAG: Lrp/AsnC family transcriptional regulator [archaeon]|nr:Lrp/AsnC family transcriptional regulator [archaeon]MDA1167315.1 Lrp/AsnC family transcriptional regulator [archaeon]
MSLNLDLIDQSLLKALQEDARRSQRDLAKVVGISQGTVANRLRRLEDEGVILGYQVKINPEKIGYGMTIMAGLRIVKGKMIEVQHKISSDPRVFAVYDVTGDWDSIVLARVKNRQDLDNLTKTVFTLDGVARSFTHVVLNTVKEDTHAFEFE